MGFEAIREAVQAGAVAHPSFLLVRVSPHGLERFSHPEGVRCALQKACTRCVCAPPRV